MEFYQTPVGKKASEKMPQLAFIAGQIGLQKASTFPSRPSRGRRPRAPLMTLPSPILRRLSRLRYTALRRGRGVAAGGGGRPGGRGEKGFWNSYTFG